MKPFPLPISLPCRGVEKRSRITIHPSLLLLTLALLLVPIARGDNCLAFVPQKEGTVWEQTSYSRKGKPEGKVEFRLASVATEDGKTNYHVEQTHFDKKGKSVFDGDLKYSCDGGSFYVDMSAFIDPQQLGMGMQGAEITVDADAISYPSDLGPGQTLDDGSISLSLGMGGPINMNFLVQVLNRNVEAKETIETPAGKFECFRISQEVVTKTILAIRVKSVDWVAPGIGSVRTESYNKSGKLMGYTELTRLETP